MSRDTLAATGCTPEEDGDERILRRFHHSPHFCVFSNMSTLWASRPNWPISPKTTRENAHFCAVPVR
jgi:hypothetical protein